MILDVLGPPGAKSGVKCAWWAGFEPHQVRKPGKSAPGGNYQRMWILSNTSFKASYKIFAESAESTRGKNPAKVPLVGRFFHSGGHCHLLRTGSFLESRGFPFLLVAASFISSVCLMHQSEALRTPPCYLPESWPGIL